MEYISTRGRAASLSFTDAMLTGLASDGGLYLPKHWPSLEPRSFADLNYEALAFTILKPLIDGEISDTILKDRIGKAYGTFKDPSIAPVRQIGEKLWVMELFHGPTFAFKDVALQLLGQLYDYVLAKRNQRITIIGATSGDTGSAAIEACRGKERVDIFMLHPKGRVSEIQRRQMTHVLSDNVFNIAIDGSFDDCQDLVKTMFADPDLRREYGLAAVNSINWVRIAAQIVYYFWGALQLGGGPVSFAVPSGNFGNVYAGYAARQMGASLEQLIIGTNANDVLARFFSKGELSLRPVVPTLSPSMDIQVSSNLERFLFDLYDRQGDRLAQEMKTFRETGNWRPDTGKPHPLGTLFQAYRMDDAATLESMQRVYRETGMILDPHSAIGVGAAQAALAEKKLSHPVIALATAHPAKFPDAVEKALGFRPDVPAELARLSDLPEKYASLPSEVLPLKDYIRAHARKVPA